MSPLTTHLNRPQCALHALRQCLFVCLFLGLVGWLVFLGLVLSLFVCVFVFVFRFILEGGGGGGGGGIWVLDVLATGKVYGRDRIARTK